LLRNVRLGRPFGQVDRINLKSRKRRAALLYGRPYLNLNVKECVVTFDDEKRENHLLYLFGCGYRASLDSCEFLRYEQQSEHFPGARGKPRFWRRTHWPCKLRHAILSIPFARYYDYIESDLNYPNMTEFTLSKLEHRSYILLSYEADSARLRHSDRFIPTSRVLT